VEMELDKNTVNNDAWDLGTYANLEKDSDVLQEVSSEGTDTLNTFPHLMEDLFSSYFKFAPKVKEEVSSEVSLNKSLIEETMTTSEYGNLRMATQLDEFNSAMAVAVTSKELVEKIRESSELSEAARDANQVNALSTEQADIDASLESLRDLLKNKLKKPLENKLKRKQGQLQKDAKKCSSQLAASEKQMQKSISGTRDQQRVAMRAAVQAASDKVDEMSQQCDAWGSEPGAITKMPLGQKIALAKRLSNADKLKKIAEYAGRIKNIAFRKQQTRIKRGATEIESIETGNDLGKMLPSELALLTPELEDEFLRKYSEKGLLQYSLNSKEKLGRGPMVVCIDTSGSMSGQREYWSKAVALALSSIAIKEKRGFVLIFFSSGSDCVEFEFPIGGKDRLQNMMSAMETFIGGGTDFEVPLVRAMSYIEGSEYKKADIIFITDDECDVSDSFAKEFDALKEEKRFSCFGISVEASHNTLDTFCDKVFPIHEMANDVAVLDGLFSVDYSK